MKTIIILIICSLHFQSFAQSREDFEDYAEPKNINHCLKILMATVEKEDKLEIKSISEQQLLVNYQDTIEYDFIYDLELDNSKFTKLKRYFYKNGIFTEPEMYKFILIAMHRKLNSKPLNLKELFERYNIKNIDTINGNYIPRNLTECCEELDKFLDKDFVDYIKNYKERSEVIKLHHSLGTTIRNQWSLWGGSRLYLYFKDRGISHPDGISSFILGKYYDWLNGNKEDIINYDKGK